MKDFDVVKFALIVCGLLVVAFGGHYVYLSYRVDQGEKELSDIKRWLENVGELSGEIDLLEEEKGKDKSGDFDQPFTYLHTFAEQAGINMSNDVTFNPRDQQEHRGFKDQEFSIDFKSGFEKPRKNLVGMIYNIETQSPRYKLVRARLTLPTKEAERDLWDAELTFLKRDPLAGDQR